MLKEQQLECALDAARALVSASENELIERYITPHRTKASRAEAVVRESGVPVWAIIGYLPAVDADIEQTATDYDLPLDAVAAAIYYYTSNRELIDDRIDANVRPAEV